jgi:Rieske Fe-S protein
MNPMNRREFVVGALATAGCGGLVSCANQNAGGAAKGPVDVGVAADYRRDGVVSRWAETHGFYLVRERGRLFAVSGICTHRKCLVAPEMDRDMQLVCDCHGSRFSEMGLVLKGPASRSLPHFGIGLDSTGHIIVDPARRFGEKEWDQPGAFIAVG